MQRRLDPVRGRLRAPGRISPRAGSSLFLVEATVRYRKKVPQSELARLRSELRAEGAVEIRRRPARPDGLVEVTWQDSKGVLDLLRPWMPAFAMAGLTTLLVALVLIAAMVL